MLLFKPVFKKTLKLKTNIEGFIFDQDANKMYSGTQIYCSNKKL